MKVQKTSHELKLSIVVDSVSFNLSIAGLYIFSIAESNSMVSSISIGVPHTFSLANNRIQHESERKTENIFVWTIALYRNITN